VGNRTFDSHTGSVGAFDPPEVVTENGRAVTTFRAGTLSGSVNISAISGGASATSIAVNVGGAAAGQAVVRAEPSSVPVTGGTTQIVAVVIDGSGNALPGAPVVFSANNGSLSSNSAITDANGEARVTLTTNRETIVRATVGTKFGEVTVRAVTLPNVTIALSGTTQPEAGLATTFTVTPSTADTGNPLRSVVIDFGDGTQENLGTISGATTISHTYARAGQYRVTATATDVQGLTGSSTIIIQVNERSSLSVTMTASPNPVSVGALQQGLVEFTASAIGATGVQYYQWDFGDGGGAFTTGGSTNHRYTAAGNYVARVTVRASNGQEGYSERTVRVTSP
jgi:PKD repeat protein